MAGLSDVANQIRAGSYNGNMPDDIYRNIPATTDYEGPGFPRLDGTAPGFLRDQALADQRKVSGAIAAHIPQLSEFARETQRNLGANVGDYLGISDEQNRNLAAMLRVQGNRSADQEWQTHQNKLAWGGQALAQARGNSAYGSGLYSTMDVMHGQNNIGQMDIRQTLRQNLESIENSLYESTANNNNIYNEQMANLEAQMDAITGNEAAQLSGLETADSSYWNGVGPHDTSYADNRRDAVETTDVGYIMNDHNFAHRQALDQGGNNARAGAAAGDYAVRLMKGYHGR